MHDVANHIYMNEGVSTFGHKLSESFRPSLIITDPLTTLKLIQNWRDYDEITLDQPIIVPKGLETAANLLGIHTTNQVDKINKVGTTVL